jgi:hypothetical protein
MHYECMNGNYIVQGSICPRFGRLVRYTTVANRGSDRCEMCGVKMGAVTPPSKPHGLKVYGMGRLTSYRPSPKGAAGRKRAGKRAFGKRYGKRY